MSTTTAPIPRVLILTPVKGAERHLPRYVELIERLDWPREQLSVALLEGDSTDGTHAAAESLLPRLRERTRRAELFRRDFGFNIPPGVPRWAWAFQQMRRAVLARARNHLLFRALDDEDWVLWIDVDVIDYPPDVLKQLLATGYEIVVPNCVKKPGGRTPWSSKSTCRGPRSTSSPVRGPCWPTIRMRLSCCASWPRQHSPLADARQAISPPCSTGWALPPRSSSAAARASLRSAGNNWSGVRPPRTGAARTSAATLSPFAASMA
jgi:glycosyltransferase involved in cell wall biosynthesis